MVEASYVTVGVGVGDNQREEAGKIHVEMGRSWRRQCEFTVHLE